MTTYIRLGDDESRPSADSYDLATTGLWQALSSFDLVTTEIVRACTDCGSGDDGPEDARSRVNFRVYKGGKVSS